MLVGYADGCVGACVQSGPNSFSAQATIARQTSGMRLFARYDLPDLTATGIVANYAHPHQTTLTASVANVGTAAAGSFVVRFLDGNTVLGQSAPLTLARGATATASYVWNSQGQRGSHSITAVVDPANSVTESDETNNRYTQTLAVR